MSNQYKESGNLIRLLHGVSDFKAHKINSILAIGLSFCEKQVEFAYENIDLSIWIYKYKLINHD